MHQWLGIRRNGRLGKRHDCKAVQGSQLDPSILSGGLYSHWTSWSTYIPQVCVRNCFFLAFAEAAKCANFRVADVPDIQRLLVGNLCDLRTGGKRLLIGSIWTLSDIFQAKLSVLPDMWWINLKTEQEFACVILPAQKRLFQLQSLQSDGQVRSTR